MNRIISLSEYREIYIIPSQKIFDPEDLYDNNDNLEWDFFINIENSNPLLTNTNRNIEEINDSVTENNIIEPINISSCVSSYINPYINPYIKLLIPFALIIILY